MLTPTGDTQGKTYGDTYGDTYKEALFYKKTGGGGTGCELCPRRCRLAPGASGACLARKNAGGTLYSLNYGRVSSLALDPIEKKPLYRFRPGSMILSAGSFGCNFFCPFCQNHSISRNIPETRKETPDSLVQKAVAAKEYGNIGIAYTYNEPSVWYEFVLETAMRAAREGLANVLVTNGYISPAPLAELLPHISAMNIDLKGDAGFYRDMCGGDAGTVMETIKTAARAGRHVEVTTLLVTGRNDDEKAVSGIAAAVSEISEEIPLHLTRFFPRYKMSGEAPTDPAFVRRAAEIARRKLKYVYAGNI